MARGVRTIVLVVTMAVTVIAVSPATSASADLGDVLGGLLGGGSKPPPPDQPPSPPSPPSPPTSPPASVFSSGGAQPKEPLLAPESACGGQTDSSLPPGAGERAMGCMLSYARVAAGLSPLRPDKALRASANDKARDVLRCQKF